MYSTLLATEWASTKCKVQKSIGQNWKEKWELLLCYLLSSPILPLQLPILPQTGLQTRPAAGTALATGRKTKNSAIGVLKDQETPINSVAVWAKNKGCRVGIATSVTVNHATPGAFYAHAAKRTLYHEIGKDLYKTGFDFYAGSDFRDATDKNNPTTDNLYEMAGKNGYTIARGYKDYLKQSKKADKMLLLQTEEASKREFVAIPYAIDRKKGEMTLQDITRSAINFLSKDLSKGFFLMVEGGEN